jgi:hypothetical protein
MKNYSLFGVLGVGSAAALALVSACTVTTINNTGEGGAGGGDDAAADSTGSSSSGGSSGASSSGASADGPTEGAASSSGAGDSGGDGGSCAANLTIGAAACDTCMKANCCSDLVACDAPGDAGVNDAGLTECEVLLDCTLNYSATADAGLTESLQTCSGGDASTGAPAVLTTLLSCASTHCGTACN